MSNNLYGVIGHFYCNQKDCKLYNKRGLKAMEFRFKQEVKYCASCRKELDREYLEKELNNV